MTLKLCDYVLMFVNRLSTTIWALVGPGRRNIVVGGEAGTGERWGRLEIFLRSLLLSLERVYPAVTSCSVARRPTGERWVFMLAWEVIAPTPSLTCVNYYLVSFSQETSSLSAFISLTNLLPCTHIYLLIDFAPLFISIAPKEITQDRNACSWLLTGTRRRFCCSKWFLLQTQQTNSRLGQNGSQHEDRQTDMNTFSMYGGVTVRSFLTKQENIYEIIATTKKWNAWVCGTATRRLFHAHRPEPY